MPENEMQYKIIPITECKAARKGSAVYLEGYANTKNQPDRYGDVPTVFAKLRDYCYDLSDYMKNPVMLIDHERTIDHLAGSMEAIKEDERGLYFRAKFSNSDYPIVKHARQVYEEGHAKAISIAGRFYHEDGEHPENLTLAKIHEISCVTVGADADALAAAVTKALKDFKAEAAPAPETELDKIFKALQRLEGGITLSADELRSLRKWTDALRVKVYGTNQYLDPADALQRIAAIEK